MLDPVRDSPLLSVRNLHTHFFADEGITKAVDGVSFDVLAGTTLGIVGETGCGKSVTARSILRIVEPPGRIVSGEILWRRNDDYVDVVKLADKSAEIRAIRGGEIGLVFQEPMTSFSPVHTIGNQIIEAIRLHCHVSKGTAHKRAVELLKMVGMPRAEGRLEDYPWQLSGGLQQRAMIAMALAGEPRLLIADEPTTALDVTTQAQILELLRDLQQHTGLTIMLITHDLGVIAEMADHVVVMYLGTVAERGPVDDIFHKPQHPYTTSLLRSIPSVHAEARTPLATVAGSIPHPFNRPSGCAFHPRCTQSITELCPDHEPERRTIGVDHWVACHLGTDAATAAVAAREATESLESPAEPVAP